MKILLSSYAFSPSVGGLEALSAMLAEQFCVRGDRVTIVTQTPGASRNDTVPYKVERRPSPLQLLRLVRWCDVFVHNNINLRSAWPLLLCHRPWVIVNSGSVTDTPKGWLKKFISRFGIALGVSEEMARLIGSKIVIPNCYDNERFREILDIGREFDLVYAGRLVSEKGVDVLLRALRQLRDKKLQPKLTIVGSGPEEHVLRELAAALELNEQVIFKGTLRGSALVEELNRHSILVVPSLYNEPFGIVALEGIACGCVVIGSHGGGLRDTIGPCGLTFPNGDSNALAKCLGDVLSGSHSLETLRAHAREHLAKFSKSAVADAYLQLLRQAISCSKHDQKGIVEWD